MRNLVARLHLNFPLLVLCEPQSFTRKWTLLPSKALETLCTSVRILLSPLIPHSPPSRPPDVVYGIYYTILYYTILYYAMLCHAMPCHAMLCYAMLPNANANANANAMLCVTTLHYTILYYTILHCTILHQEKRPKGLELNLPRGALHQAS